MKRRSLKFIKNPIFAALPLLYIVAGCGGQKDQEPVVVKMEGARLELVQKRASMQKWRNTSHSGDANKLPRNLLPGGYVPQAVEEGSSHYAVKGLLSSKDENQGDARLWVFDKKWKLLGRVQGVRGKTWIEGHIIDFAWLDAGRKLGVVMHDKSQVDARLSVGVVDLSSLQWKEIHRLNGFWQAECYWLENELAIFFTTLELKQETNAVVAVDFRNNKARTIYRDVVRDGKPRRSLEQFFTGFTSPDKTRVAIDMTDFDDTQSNGIWLLDIRTDSFREITGEKQKPYHHTWPQWTGDKQLTFYRREGAREEERWSVYRVIFPDSPPKAEIRTR